VSIRLNECRTDEKINYFWTTHWVNLLLAPVCAGFVIWSIIRWMREPQTHGADLRGRMGSVGLACGVSSAVLLLVFYVHIWATGQLIAHGSVLFIIDWTGQGLAAAGFLTALAARRWLRPSAAVVSIVMFIQWYGLLIPGLRIAALLSTAMYLCVAAAASLWLLSSWHSVQARGVHTD
jgi:hypothetical protein